MDKFIDVVSYTKNTDDHYGTGGFAFYLYGLIKMIKPDVLVKGGDYEGKTVVGTEFSGELKLVDFVDGKSTTKTIQKIQESQC